MSHICRDGRLEQLYSLHQSIDIDFLQLSLRNLGQDLLHQAIGHQTTKVKQYRLQCLAVHGYLRGMLGKPYLVDQAYNINIIH
jgi:hypothetical protein